MPLSEEIDRMFYIEELQKQITKNLDLKKKSRKKVVHYMLKAAIILLTIGLIKNTEFKWVNIFPDQNLYIIMWQKQI